MNDHRITDFFPNVRKRRIDSDSNVHKIRKSTEQTISPQQHRSSIVQSIDEQELHIQNKSSTKFDNLSRRITRSQKINQLAESSNQNISSQINNNHFDNQTKIINNDRLSSTQSTIINAQVDRSTKVCTSNHRQAINQLVQINESTQNIVNNVRTISDQVRNVQFMRDVFKLARSINRSPACVQNLHSYLIEFEFYDFYEEFCRNLKCTLQYENANPEVINILTTVSIFLLSAKQKYSIENLKRTTDAKIRLNNSVDTESSTINEKEGDTLENDENVPLDEIIQLVNESTGRISDLNRSSSTTSKLVDHEEMHKIYKIYCNLLDSVINDVLIPFTNSVNVNSRLNTCFLLNKLIKSIVDLDVILFDRLKFKLLERLIDKNFKIRSTAAYLLYRFQDQQLQLKQIDVVQDALCFHLKYDSSPVVRLSCLDVILVNRETITVILSKTRDVNDKVRLNAFIKLAKKVDFKLLNNDERLTLLRNGLNDRKQSIVDTFKQEVILAWVKSYNGDLINVLKGLQLNEWVRSFSTREDPNDFRTVMECDNFKLIKLFVTYFFESTFTIDRPQLSAMHSTVIDFCKLYLDDRFLPKAEHFDNETFFLWSMIISFLKRKEDELDQECLNNSTRLKLKRQFSSCLKSNLNSESNKDVLGSKYDQNQIVDNFKGDQNNNDANLFDQNNNNQTVNIPPVQNKRLNNTQDNQTISNLPYSTESEDHSILDLIIPKFSEFIEFFRSFCESCDENSGRLNDEFIFRQLISNLENYECEDNLRRTMIFEMIDYLLEHDKITSNIVGYTDCLMDYAKRNMFKNNKEFYFYSMNLLKKMYQKLEADESAKLNQKITVKDVREVELENANRAMQLHELKDKLDDALSKCQYDQAHEYQTEIHRIKQECDRLTKCIEKMKSDIEYQETRKEQIEKQFQIVNYPTEHIKHLQILEISLKSAHQLNSNAQTKIDQYILPGILSTDRQVRYHALRALNQACFLSLSTANKFCRLYFEICLKDNSQIQNCALEGLIDSLVEHGGEMLYGRFSSKRDSEISSMKEKASPELNSEYENLNQTELEELISEATLFTTTSSNEIRSSRTRSRTRIGESTMNTHRIVVDECMMHKSQFIEIDSIRQTNTEEDEIRAHVTKEFIRFLLMFAKHEDKRLSYTSVIGICKLMLLGRIYSPKLLSELILLYFNSNTNRSIAQSIGTWLPIYCPQLSSLIDFEINLLNHMTGQHCLIECFMYTVQGVYLLICGQPLESSFGVEHSNYYDSSIDVQKVINFMLNLLEPINHPEIAIQFCEQILTVLQIEREDEYLFEESYITKYLIPSLNSISLIEITDDELQKMMSILKTIQDEHRFQELKRASCTKIEKFFQKLIDLCLVGD